MSHVTTPNSETAAGNVPLKVIGTTSDLVGSTPNIEDPRRIIRQGMAVILLFFGAFGMWAVFGTITGAVVAPGTVKIESERKTVQHLEGGIVDAILIAEGDEVTQGQTLIVLKSIQVDATVDMLHKNLMTYMAMRDRFQAEKEVADDILWGKELLGMVDEYQGGNILAGEKKIFEARRDTYHSQITLLRSQISQISAQICGLQEQLEAEHIIIGTLHEELDAKRQLVAERFLEKSHVLELERQLASHRGNRGNIQQNIAEAQQRIMELELRIEDATTRFVEDATNQMGNIDSQILQVREQLRPMTDAQSRLRVIAPVTGRIVGLKVHSPGGVVGPGDPLMDIVPADSPMIVETHIPVDKITEVYLEQAAQVQMDAFDRRTTPLIKGHVVYIGADRQEEQTPMGPMPYYKCHVEVFSKDIQAADIYLSPGMPATVFITTKKQTILNYMFEPLLKSWDKALRD